MLDVPRHLHSIPYLVPPRTKAMKRSIRTNNTRIKKFSSQCTSPKILESGGRRAELKLSAKPRESNEDRRAEPKQDVDRALSQQKDSEVLSLNEHLFVWCILYFAHSKELVVILVPVFNAVQTRVQHSTV